MAEAEFPTVVLVHQGSVEQGETFFAARWPQAVAIADPEHVLYGAFGVERGRVGQVLGVRSVLRGVAAALRGHGVGKVVGDPWRMPGAFLIVDGVIVWTHAPAHAGDQPDLAVVRAQFAAVGGSTVGQA